MDILPTIKSTFLFFLFGSLARLLMFVSLSFISIILVFLGLFFIIPKAAFLFGVCLGVAWMILVFFCLFDLELVKLIIANDEKFSINLLLLFLFGWSMGVILNWDYRAISLLVSVGIGTLQANLIDGMCLSVRRVAMIPLSFMYTFMMFFYLLIFNMGWIPGIEGAETRILFTFHVLERSIPYSAFGGFNTAAIAMFGLGVDELKTRFLYRKTSRLRTIAIPVSGADQFTIVDFSYLDGFLPKTKD